jgi:hypothetical protein
MMNDISTSPQGALITACALGAVMLALILWRTSMSARARASERARIWGELKRPELEARAQRKADERASGARMSARIRGALMLAVALVALGATNLSAHGTLDMIARAGLESLDAQIAVIVVFEMFLAILGALSLWHMNHGTGFNKYEAGVWLMAALMGGMSWWGSGSAVFALWPLLAAVAWHMVITFGREHKPSAVVRWVRLRLGRATTRDADALLTERLITRIVNHAYYANTHKREIMRAHQERAYLRAWARADELGILTPEVRARIQTRIAARYAGARALAPEAVAHMNPWNERASMSARSNARAVRPVSAPPALTLDVSAHVPDDARALEDERAYESAHTDEVSAHDADRVLDAIERNFKSTPKVIVWAKAYYEANKELPTRNQVAAVAELSPGHCARWLTNTRKALAAG